MLKLRLSSVLVFLASALFSANSNGGQAGNKTPAAADWLIDPAGLSGVIRRATTRADLVRLYGRGNVEDGKMDVGEGETVPATIIFASDPKRRIGISWEDELHNKNSVRVQIDGDASLWHTVGGVTLGTRLKTLERMNGGQFNLSGFAWDYSGTVRSWQGGKLESAFQPGDQRWRTVLRLSPVHSGPNQEISRAEKALLGDGEFSSADPNMQRLNPAVYQIIWFFPVASLASRPPN